MNGKMIVIEGLDGSGKSTQIKLLRNRLAQDGVNSFQIKLPYYEDRSSELVKMYLAGEFGTKPGDVNAYAASTFYAVDRYASFKKFWHKEYDEGRLILADRYTTSNAVHQMTKLNKNEWDTYLEWLFHFEYEMIGIPEPSCVIYLDMPVDVSQKLMTGRYAGDENKKDVHERDISYLNECYKAAGYAAKKLGWNIIECSENGELRSISDISDDIYTCVKRYI